MAAMDYGTIKDAVNTSSCAYIQGFTVSTSLHVLVKKFQMESVRL